MASAAYLREVHPNNQMVKYLVDDMNTSLSKLQKESDRKITTAKRLIAENFFNQMRALKFDTIDLNRGVFKKEVVMGVITDLLALKTSLQAYMRLDMSSELELSILEKVLNHYRSTIRHAGSLEAEVQLPKRDIVVTLEDAETSDAVTLDTMPLPPKAYLFGLTPEDVQVWIDVLSF